MCSKHRTYPSAVSKTVTSLLHDKMRHGYVGSLSGFPQKNLVFFGLSLGLFFHILQFLQILIVFWEFSGLLQQVQLVITPFSTLVDLPTSVVPH